MRGLPSIQIHESMFQIPLEGCVCDSNVVVSFGLFPLFLCLFSTNKDYKAVLKAGRFLNVIRVVLGGKF